METNAKQQKQNTNQNKNMINSVKHTFFSFLVRSSVLKGATPRTIAKARPKVNKSEVQYTLFHKICRC